MNTSVRQVIHSYVLMLSFVADWLVCFGLAVLLWSMPTLCCVAVLLLVPVSVLCY